MVAQAPEHVVENEKALAKAGDDPKKRRKVVRKKAPEGFVNWGQQTFEKLIASDPEPLTSRFRVTHAMLLSVIARPGDAFTQMRQLLEDNHEERRAQLRHIRRAIAIYRSLLDGGVIERLEEPDAEGRTLRLTVDLQQDFALNQPLSTFALAAFDLLDPESPSYALDMVSVVESTLDDPRQILAAQTNKAKRRGRREDEGRRDRVRGAHGTADGHQLPPAARGAALPRLRALPQVPPLGRRPPALPQVGHP